MRTPRQHQVRAYQHRETGSQQPAVADAVRQAPERVGRGGIHQIHCHHDQRDQGHRHAALLRLQHQKGLAEACQREHCADDHYPPVGGAQAPELRALQRIDADVGRGRGGFAHAKHQQRHRGQTGQDGNPENRPKIIGPQQHQCSGDQRPGESTYRVQRLAQAKGRTAHGAGCDVCDQGVARRAAQALAYAVQQPCGHDQLYRRRHGEQRFAQRAQPITGNGQAFAPPQVVAQRAGKHLDDQRSGLCQTLDDPDRQRTGAQRRHHEQRQQAVNHLGRHIHQQADKAQHPDRGRDGPQSCLFFALCHRACLPDWPGV